jgi:hypothetical protein
VVLLVALKLMPRRHLPWDLRLWRLCGTFAMRTVVKGDAYIMRVVLLVVFGRARAGFRRWLMCAAAAWLWSVLIAFERSCVLWCSIAEWVVAVGQCESVCACMYARERVLRATTKAIDRPQITSCGSMQSLLLNPCVHLAHRRTQVLC